MLKWRRVSTGGCWEISLTMQWLTRTHSHTHARASSPVEALFPSLSQFSHIIWIHLNVVWLKPISLHQKRLRWMEGLTIPTSTRAGKRLSVGPRWKVWSRLHAPLNQCVAGYDGHSLHLWWGHGGKSRILGHWWHTHMPEHHGSHWRTSIPTVPQLPTCTVHELSMDLWH